MQKGYSVVLRCVGKARPTAEVIWLRDNQTVSPGSQVLHETDGLLLTHLHTGDTGVYQCLLRNTIGTRLSRAATLTILGNG